MSQDTQGEVRDVSLAEIYFDHDLNEGRGRIAPIDVADLMRDIELQGLIQPIIVCELNAKEQENTGCLYRLIAGYRRASAFKFMGRPTIKAIVRERMSEIDARFLNLSENTQRKQLTLVQEARALKRLRELKVSRQTVSKRLGVSEGWVQVRYMVLDMPEDVQKEFDSGVITQTHVRDLYTVYKKFGEDRLYEEVKDIKKLRERYKQQAVKVNTGKKSPNVKRQRNRVEIFEMMGHIQYVYKNGFHTRCMGWCAGEVSDAEIFEDLKEILGDSYNIPASLEDAPR